MLPLHELIIYLTLFLGILCAVTGKRYAACILGSIAFTMLGIWQLVEGRLVGLAAFALVGLFMYYFFYLRRLHRKK